MQILLWTKRLLSKPIYKIVSLGVILLFILGVSFFFPREIHIGESITLFFWRQNALESIRDGVAMLKTSPPLEFVEGSRTQIALAVLDTKSGKITEHRIWVSPSGELLKRDTELPIQIKWWNSFNTYFEVKDSPHIAVVANKYRITRSYLPEQGTLSLDENAPKSSHIDMVYVPYSDFINQPEVVNAGIDYVEKHAEQAFKELRKDKVESRSKEGVLVTDVVPLDLVKTIVLVEHVDPGWWSLSEDEGRKLVERTLAIIGANQEWAYRYTNSPAGANGLAQFIRPTYESMVRLYPSAGLITDYKIGMADHTNAFKAIALYFDEHLEDFPEKEMLAAVYNGGSSRTSKAILAKGERWSTSSHLAGETIQYVKKYTSIASLGIFQ